LTPLPCDPCLWIAQSVLLLLRQSVVEAVEREAVDCTAHTHRPVSALASGQWSMAARGHTRHRPIVE
jgi:hypothetical protein